jgi:hypothetical protein
MLAVYNIGISNKKGENMKHTNLTIWTKQEELKHIKRELANAKRRHKRQQTKLDAELTAEYQMVENYHKAGVNELRELTHTGEQDVVYDALRKIELAHKIAAKAMRTANIQKWMQKCEIDNAYENTMAKEIVELQKEIETLQNEEVA